MQRRFLVVGDKFVKPELFISAIERHMPGEDLQFYTMETDWPIEPFRHGPEVSEYLGSVDVICDMVRDVDAIVTQLAPITAAVLDCAEELRIIGCCRGGPVNVNIEAATQRGIPVIYAPGRNAIAVAEFTVGLILAEVRNIGRAHADMKKGIWRGDLYCYHAAGRELNGLVAGLIGFGSIGRLMVGPLGAFGMKVMVYDPFVPKDEIEAYGAEEADLEILLRSADVVSLHARVTPQTRGMIGARELALMKPTAYLVNTARGPLVDYDALYEALKAKRIAGAALDTFAEEPVPESDRLLELDNVTLTPHIAGASRETAERAAEMVAEDIGNFFAGRPMRNCYNRAALAKIS
ncbi:MAG TPA: 2-hydroxyacid dehydrogenase [Firmicutes bacterium]|nr:2-hydroxyacid dehydrogenase [Bacillota bacterium]